MWPFSYSRCAIDIVYFAEKPSLRDASCCSVVVRNGAYGDLRYGLRSTELTAKSASPRRSASATACSESRCSRFAFGAPFSSPAGVKSRPCATRRPSTETRVAVNETGPSSCPAASRPARANSASRSQYLAARKAIRSRSRSTTSRTATDWTRPATAGA